MLLLCGGGGGGGGARSTVSRGRMRMRMMMMMMMHMIGVETSCDDTAVAVLDGQARVLFHQRVTHHQMLARWGGVKPDEAAQLHAQHTRELLRGAVSACQAPSDGWAVGVTVGPGLALCLGEGVRAAAEVARQLQAPLLPVHHMEAHLLVAGVDTPPFLTLLVSGGHCLLARVHAPLGSRYTLLGATIDDSLGEAYDKVARLLGLEVSGKCAGQVLEEEASLGDPSRFLFPVGLSRQSQRVAFSFSGLKTAVLRTVRSLEAEGVARQSELRDSEARRLVQQARLSDSHGRQCTLDLQTKRDVCAGFQRAALRQLEKKTRVALRQEKEARILVLAGGVASNEALRSRMEQLCREEGYHLVVPPPHLCTDNGIMVARAAMERWNRGERGLQGSALEPTEDLVSSWVRSRWPLDELR